MNRRGRKPIIDKEVAFNLWLNMSIAQAVKTYAREYGTNPNTGKPFTDPAIWRSANTYIIRNPNKARAKIEQKFGKMTDDDWHNYLLERAHFAFQLESTDPFVSWAKNHGYEEKEYNPFVAKRRAVMQSRGRKGGF